MNKQEIYKKLQNLFSWSEFYRVNDNFAAYEFTKEQINEYTNKYKL